MPITLNGTTGITTPAITNNGTLTQTGAATLSSTLQSASTIGVGGATPAASGAGITFPATASASSDANTLDDYEEGTWTPTLGGTTTYNGRFGTYTKVGNLVTVLFSLNVNSIGTGTRSTIAGLPFTPANMSSGTLPLYSGLSVSLTWAGCYAEPDAIIYLTGNTGTVATTSINGSTAVLGSGTIIYGAITFRT